MRCVYVRQSAGRQGKFVGIQYRLYPPFLSVAETSSFADGWERFCCKLLNLDKDVGEIQIRAAPEQGVDIYYPAKQIAYQCKSIESGRPGDFNVTKVVKSYEAALAIKGSLPWKEYVLCTNVDLTGTTLATLKDKIPNIRVLGASYWQQLCEKFAVAVARNFQAVIDIQPSFLSFGAHMPEIDAMLDELPAEGDPGVFLINLYSNRHDTIYRVPVRSDLKIKTLLDALMQLFGLPGQTTFEIDQISVSLGHSLVREERPIPFDKSLAEAGIGPGTLVTYWTTFRYRDREGRSFDGHVMNLQVAHDLSDGRSRAERRDAALKKFGALVASRFREVDQMLTSGC